MSCGATDVKQLKGNHKINHIVENKVNLFSFKCGVDSDSLVCRVVAPSVIFTYFTTLP